MPESAKEGATGLPEGSDIGLGAGCREFESPHSDQNTTKIIDFSGVFHKKAQKLYGKIKKLAARQSTMKGDERMAYSELIKNFERIRDYMREFYVYGFKSRDEFTKKSARSYDDERRRVESWLGDYMRFRQTADGKKVFLSIDSRISHHNPFYKAWKAKSFTDGDITLHFLIFDVLSDPDIALPLNGIMDEIDRRLSCFDEPKTFDASTVRKKLKEYAEQGLICTDRSAKTLLYRRAATAQLACTDALDFFPRSPPAA